MTGTKQMARMACIILGVLGLSLVAARQAEAVPSFARQTGLACEACHTVFPELTPFGRLFKINGFTISNIKQITATTPQQNPTLALNKIPPVATMFRFSDSSVAKAVPDSAVAGAKAQNNTFMFPEAFSIYYAGSVAPKLGAFVQVTYDGTEGQFGLDMADVRFANQGMIGGHPFVYGVSANNMVTFSDPWQDTPAYWFPYSSSPVAPSPAASPQVVALMNLIGVGPYFYFPDLVAGGSLYVSAEGYRSVALGVSILDSASMGVISGITPYWRIAWQKDWGRNSLEIGTYGLAPHLYPGMGHPLSGPTNDYTDVAGDMQYQYLGSDNIFSVEATGIHETQDWHASYPMMASNPSDTLDTVRLTGTWYYQRRYGAHVQLFDTWGSRDASLYAPAAVTGSRTGKPDTTGVTLQVDYLPWENTKLIAQYTAYSKFNGAGSNYDGSGRSASDNNTLYLAVWFAF